MHFLPTRKSYSLQAMGTCMRYRRKAAYLFLCHVPTAPAICYVMLRVCQRTTARFSSRLKLISNVGWPQFASLVAMPTTSQRSRPLKQIPCLLRQPSTMIPSRGQTRRGRFKHGLLHIWPGTTAQLVCCLASVRGPKTLLYSAHASLTSLESDLRRMCFSVKLCHLTRAVARGVTAWFIADGRRHTLRSASLLT